MFRKLPVLGFALVTAISGTALAHDARGPHAHGPGVHDPSVHGHGGPARHDGYRGRGAGVVAVDLRYSDLNRDGWVTMREALDSARSVFHRQDRDNNRVLSRREVGYGGVDRGDRNNDGRVSLPEYQRAVRAFFQRLDTNRDGVLARHEIAYGPRGSRSAGWRR